MPNDERRLVYSTDGSMPLPPPEHRATAARSKAVAPRGGSTPPADGIVRAGCEKRRGGTVTLVYGLAPNELEPTARELRRRCATGGTAKDGIITLQGDRRDAVTAYFAERKRPVRRMGG